MKLLSLIAVVALTSVAACSSDDSASPGGTGPGGTAAPCNQDPWQCPAGQTCWVNDQAGAFACLNSAAAGKGAECVNTIGAPTCGDGLVCLQLGPAGGTCSAYCDPAKADRGCAADEICGKVTIRDTNSSFFACVSRAPADAGTDATSETATDATSETATDATSETATDAKSDASSEAATDGAAAEASADASAD